MDLFKPLDLNVPAAYGRIEMHVTVFQHWDNAPTAVYAEVHTVNPDHQILRKRFTYADVRSTDAIVKDLVMLFKLFDKLPVPADGVDVYIHDVAGFLAITGQMHVFSNTLQHTVNQLRKILRTMKTEVRFHLGDPELKLKFQIECLSLVRESSTIVPTLEAQGHTGRNHIGKQTAKRVELSLWKS